MAVEWCRKFGPLMWGRDDSEDGRWTLNGKPVHARFVNMTPSSSWVTGVGFVWRYRLYFLFIGAVGHKDPLRHDR